MLSLLFKLIQYTLAIGLILIFLALIIEIPTFRYIIIAIIILSLMFGNKKVDNFDNNLSNNDKEKAQRSRYIPQKIRDAVWNRDKGKCVQCDSNENLEFDHIIPFSKGGANTYRNLQLLCQNCNRKKSNKIG